MNTTIEFLDALKAKTGAGSDYQLHKILGVTRSGISSYRCGRSYFDDEVCLKVASILEISPALVFAAVHAERAKSEPEKAVWKSIFEKLGGLAASIALAAIILPNPVNTGSAQASQRETVYYVKSKRRKKNPFELLLNQLIPA